MIKIAINGFGKKIGIFLFLFLLLPDIVYANPIVINNLYSSFESSRIASNDLLWLSIIAIGMYLEFFIIFIFIDKNIVYRQKKLAIYKIFIPIFILNLFTVFCVQIIAESISYFAELFPLIMESIVVYFIFKKASQKNILDKLISIKKVILIIFIANLLSFSFGLFVNLIYRPCDNSMLTAKTDYPSFCYYLPAFKEDLKGWGLY